MSQAISDFIRKNAFAGQGQKVAAMPESEAKDYLATRLSRECLEEMAKERVK